MKFMYMNIRTQPFNEHIHLASVRRTLIAHDKGVQEEGRGARKNVKHFEGEQKKIDQG